MRIRRLTTLAFGAAVGAGAMYLLDPEHGQQRRRDARSRAMAQARHGAIRVVRDARDRAQDLTVAAVAGFHESRGEAGRRPDTPD